MQGVVVNGGGGVMVWVVGCQRQGWVIQGVIVDGGGSGWWCGWQAVNAGGDAGGGVVVVAIVVLTREVVGWGWGSVEVGWQFVAAGGGGHCRRLSSCR